MYAGGFVGPIGFGFLATHASFASAWLVAAAAMLVACGGVLVGRRMLLAYTARRRADGLVSAHSAGPPDSEGDRPT
ncbi:hypothetical protein ACFSVJ_06390 [Prauserella oleivorans]